MDKHYQYIQMLDKIGLNGVDFGNIAFTFKLLGVNENYFKSVKSHLIKAKVVSVNIVIAT